MANDFPQDPVEGQVAVGADDNLYWFSNNAWHNASGSGVEFGYPSFYYIPLLTASNQFGTGSFYRRFVDTTMLTNGYLSNSTQVTDTAWSDGARVSWHLRLGPKGSIWGVELLHTLGPDHGRIRFDWSTATEDDPDSTPPEGGLEETYSSIYTGGKFHTYPSSGDPQRIDCNYPTRQVNRYAAIYSQFRIGGAPGAVHTAWNFANGWFTSDGGPGMWNFMIVTDGKAAGSTGYRLGIQEIVVRRYDGEGY